MQDTVKRQTLGLAILLSICVAILLFSNFGKSATVKVYDCREAHWHPDYPVDVKEACRKLLNKKVLTTSLNTSIMV
jgi:hypothetical protein